MGVKERFGFSLKVSRVALPVKVKRETNALGGDMTKLQTLTGKCGAMNGGMRTFALIVMFSASCFGRPGADGRSNCEYKLLATNKTSTMQRELNEAAGAGFKFVGVMGGETAFGGAEVVVVMSRDLPSKGNSRFEYRLLATSMTSTMQRELQEAADAGFEYKGQTVFPTTFGGKEVVVILERDPEPRNIRYEYKLLATSKTSTMQKELNEVGADGFEFVGVTVGQTAFGGKEVVSILRRGKTR